EHIAGVVEPGVEVRRADERDRSVGLGGDLLDGAPGRADERRAEEQVLGRVAGDGELGKEDEVGAGVEGLCAKLEGAGAVGPEIADDAVHLCESEPHSSSGGVFAFRSKTLPRQRKNAITPSRKHAAPTATRKRLSLDRPIPTSTAAAAKSRIAAARIDRAYGV